MKKKQQNKNQAPIDALRNQILFGDLKSGEYLRQQDIADRFQISRTPAREMLKTLEAEGLVENVKNCGFRIIGLTPRGAVELIDLRTLLEGYAARLTALRINEKLIDKLDFLADEIQETEKRYADTHTRDDMLIWSKKELEFHKTIIDASEHYWLQRVTNSISFQWLSFMADQTPKNDNPEEMTHHDIVRALASGNPDTAEIAIRKHLHPYRVAEIEKQFGPVLNVWGEDFD